MNIRKIIRADNFNQLFLEAINLIYTEGILIKPRGLKCKEIIASQLILTNPKNCLITIKDRKLNYAYLLIEKFMYLSGFQKPKILIAYNSKMKDFLNTKTGLFDGAYGPRIKQGNQLNHCYYLLKSDKDTRQAVITINDWTDRKDSLDKPCTLSFNFLLRENKLNMIVTMRSNDLLWGTCLDIPAFCFIQEVMAYWLNVEIGEFILQPASLHIYSNFEQTLLGFLKLNKQPKYYDNNECKQILNFNEVNNEKNPKWNINFENTKDSLEKFWKCEKNIRNKLSYVKTEYDVINQYLEKLLIYWKKKYDSKLPKNR